MINPIDNVVADVVIVPIFPEHSETVGLKIQPGFDSHR